jgi:hypothetical protein
MTQLRIPSEYRTVCGQLLVMLVLVLAIALRSVSITGAETPRGQFDISTATESQHDANHSGPARAELDIAFK